MLRKARILVRDRSMTYLRSPGNVWAPAEPASTREVRFRAVNSQSDFFQTQVVIHRVSQFLFASQIVLGRLNRCVTKQELNLFKFSPGQVA